MNDKTQAHSIEPPDTDPISTDKRITYIEASMKTVDDLPVNCGKVQFDLAEVCKIIEVTPEGNALGFKVDKILSGTLPAMPKNPKSKSRSCCRIVRVAAESVKFL